MEAFREREQSHEAKFKLDEELAFKARCRRNKMLGLWAGEQLGFPQAEAEAYARSLVGLALDPAGETRVVDKVVADLSAAGRITERQRVMEALAECATRARHSLAREYPRALAADHVQVGG